MSKAIRPLYDTFGAEGYYREHAGEYSNPHEPEVAALVVNNLYRIDSSHVLDFCAGSGEVTRALMAAGIDNVTGSDPFTRALYGAQTGRPCFDWSFRDIIRGAAAGEKYSCIISAFALHLCPEKELFPLCWNLLQIAPVLIAVTPHKRPEIEKMNGFSLLWEDHICTIRGKKVRMKAYGIKNIH